MIKWKDLSKTKQQLIEKAAQESFIFDIQECHSDYLTVPRDELLKHKIKDSVGYYFDYLQYTYDDVPSDRTLEYIGEEIGSYIFYHSGVCSFCFTFEELI